MTEAIERLYRAVVAARGNDPADCRTARLLAQGQVTIAKKVVEEASEVSLAYVTGERGEVVRETADLIYNLVALLCEMGISPDEIWREMCERERLLGIAGKRPKSRPKPNQKAGTKTAIGSA